MIELVKKSKKIHPFLVAFFPILIIYSQNIGRIEIEELFLPTIVIVGSAIGLYYFLKSILKNENKSAIIVTLILIMLFSYGHIYYLLNDVTIDEFDIGKNRYLIPAFGLLLGISIFLTIKIKTALDNATTILNTISVVLILVAVGNIGLILADTASCENCSVYEGNIAQELSYNRIDFSSYFEPHKFSLPEENPPDVYYLILDEYARNDAFLEYHNFDNSEITNFLTQKGFHVAKHSFANYPLSMQSITATMNMRYINFLADEVGEEVRNYKPLNEKTYGLFPDNQVMKNFKAMGYKIINFNVFSTHEHELPLADLGLCDRTINVLDNKLFDTIARTTIFGYYVERWAEDELRKSTMCAFEEFSSVEENFEEPVFVWAHITMPHSPYIFGPNGEPITPGVPLLLTANPEHRVGGWDEMQQYIQQVQFGNKMMKKIVNEILSKEKPAIIIFQSDHGTAWDVNWFEPSEDDVWERLRIFNAMYFPDEEKRIMLDSDRTSVNTFRLVFNSYFESDYEILENKMYWGWNSKPYYFEEVTNHLLEK
jgi:hypothetical protein